MRFSGQGPNLKNALAASLSGHLTESGTLVAQYHDHAADWPWTVQTADAVRTDGRPYVGDLCAGLECTHTFPANEMVYLTIEPTKPDGEQGWVCWRHIEGMTEPVRGEPE
jgi:hypothetical protein